MTVENPYNNEVAFNDVLKMMKRKDIITVNLIIDEYGYECAQLESKKIEKFNLQLNNSLSIWLVKYLKTGEISHPLPDPKENLVKSQFSNANEMVSEILIDQLKHNDDFPYLRVVPEIVDKPDRRTVTYNYPNGILVFKVNKTDEIISILASKGF